MDDLELEARLRTHLHRRLDDVPIPGGLASNVSQALATAARPIGLATRTGRIRLGWAAIAAAAVLVVGAIGIGKVLAPSGPGAQPTSTPLGTGPIAPEREFLVLPPNGALVPKPASTLASGVLDARLRAFGIGNFTSRSSEVIIYSVPTDGPSDASIRAVLTATGDVRVVALPAADYGPGMRSATLGAPLPKDEPALFGWDGIASMTSVALCTADCGSQGPPVLEMTLNAPAAQAFADYVAAHPGETYAIVVDGRVALLPITQAPLNDGSFNISNGQIPGGSQPSAAYSETVAILVGGELPEAWRGATSPVLITEATAEAAALAATSKFGTLQSAGLGIGTAYSIARGDFWQVVWHVELVLPACSDTRSCAFSPGPYLVNVDAVTGEVIHIGQLQ